MPSPSGPAIGPEKGLSSVKARDRLERHGPNLIENPARSSRWRDLARQFTHPLALLLWLAAGLAWAGGIPVLAVAVVAVIALNAFFAFFQELEAEKATEALREYLPPRATVIRDGVAVEIEAEGIVPGDVLIIEEGDRLAADARLISGSIEVDASPLTGESEPVVKSAGSSSDDPGGIEANDLVFSGELCTGGEAEAEVFATGMATELGHIATLSQRVSVEMSPLQVQINSVAWLIAGVAVGMGVLFAAIGLALAGLPPDEAIPFAIGILVANVPEGLLPTITLALAVAVRRMARRKALVKRLTAVETLGSADVICTDKTGTLTEGRMKAIAIWADGCELTMADRSRPERVAEPFSGLLRTASRCNNASVERLGETWSRSGDPSESALLVAAAELGEETALEQGRGTRKDLFRFDPRLKRMTTIDQEPDGSEWSHTKGAPLEVLSLCDSVRGVDGDRELDESARAAVERAFETYARNGLRVLGFAERCRPHGQNLTREESESGLTFLGLIALRDPPRPEVRAAIKRCRNAGIRVIVVTGDHGLTAASIARDVGLPVAGMKVVSGADVEAMTGPERTALIQPDRTLIVSRSNPETKLHLVEALQRLDHTVAMTGDGANDAPALRRADIGIAMGASGTDVAREASTMVLTDDNFASITAAIEEGRVVYENIRKFITYIFAHATPEVMPFLVFALAGGAIPLPITALLILAIDLGTETLPALALGREPAEPGILDRPPRRKSERIIDRSMLIRAWGWLGLVEGVLVTGGFLLVLIGSGWSPGADVSPGSPLHDGYLTAVTMTFAGITACQVGTAFAARTTRSSLRAIGVFSNRLLLWGIAFEILFAAAIIYIPPVQDIFNTRALGWEELVILATFPLIVWGTDETRRYFVRRRIERETGAS